MRHIRREKCRHDIRFISCNRKLLFALVPCLALFHYHRLVAHCSQTLFPCSGGEVGPEASGRVEKAVKCRSRVQIHFVLLPIRWLLTFRHHLPEDSYVVAVYILHFKTEINDGLESSS
jgi:hypothetical protein